jgi:predicted nucleotidyltransferase
MTPEQQALVDALRKVLEADPQVEAAWLSGSLGRGGGDAFSDVDVLVLAPPGEAAAMGQRYATEVAAIAPPVLVNVLYGGRVVSVVTAAWERFDLSFVEPAELGGYHAPRLTLLFNHGDLNPPDQLPEPYAASPGSVRPIIEEFLRVLGLLVVAEGREEWVVALSGLDILRQLTLDLMLEENGVAPADRGGVKRRNPFLTPAQRGELEGLTPVAPNRDSVRAANVEIAGLFLPRARRLADSVGLAWPAALEEATRRYLRERIGLEIAD